MADVKEKSTTEKVQEKVKPAASGTPVEEMIQKYQKPALMGLGILLALIAGFTYYKYNQSQNDVAAQTEMYKAVFYFEKDSLDLALKGDGKEMIGLQDIAEEYSSTQAGKLASFYTGIIYLKKGKFEDAIYYLDKYDSKDGLFQARAWSLMGDAYSELNDLDNAITYYKKASGFKPNEQITPTYLMKLALSYELKQEWKNAADTYGRIITDFPKAQEVSDAKKYKAKTETLAAE